MIFRICVQKKRSEGLKDKFQNESRCSHNRAKGKRTPIQMQRVADAEKNY